jgi:large subunit ribosomal protein L18
MYTPFNKTQKRARRHARTRARLSGTETRPRLVVFRSLNNMHVQLVDDTKGKTLIAAHDMKDVKGTKTERAKAVGTQVAELAKKAGIEACVFDRNGYMYHGRVKALAEAAREAGLKF